MKSIRTPETDGLATRTLWMTVAKSIGFIVSFILPLVLVRTLNQHEFGLYKQAFQVITTALSVLGFQFAASVYYFMEHEPRKKPQIALNVLLFYGVIGSVMALWFVCYPRWITVIFKSDDLVPTTPLLGIAIFVMLISSGLEGFMLVNRDARLVSVTVVILQLAKTALLLGASIFFGSIRAIVIAFVLQGVLQSAILVTYLYFRFGRFWQSLDFSLFKAQLSNSLPFGLGSLAVGVQYDLHNYFVSHYFSAADFAIYSVGCFQLPMLMVLVDAIETVLYPEVARVVKQASYAQVIRIWLNAIRFLAFCFVPTCILMLVLRREIIITLFTKNYLSAETIFAINLAGVLLLAHVSYPVVRAFAEFRYFRLKLCLIFLPLNWFALYFAIQAIGLVGAIAVTVLVRLLDVSVTSIMVGRRLGMRWCDLRLLAPIGRIVAAAAAAGCFTFFIQQALWRLPSIVVLGICSAVFGVAFLVAGLVAGVVTAEERAKVRELLWRFDQLRWLGVRFSPASER